MRKIKEVLRFKWALGMSNRRIAVSCGIARPMVSEYLLRAQSAGLSWPVPEDMSDARLERLLFPPPPDLPTSTKMGHPLRRHSVVGVLWMTSHE